MRNTFKYIAAYSMWFVDFGLSAWLFFLSRTTLLAFLAVINIPGDYWYAKRAELADKVFVLLIGMVWLAFIVFTEEYFRAGVPKDGLTKRFAKVTGLLVLCIFIVDLFLFFLQGIGGSDVLRWLVLSAELVVGLSLIVYGKKKGTNKST